MDDLCKGIGISKKTLYQLFTNKDELVELVVLAESTNIVELFKEKASLSENAIDTLLSVSIEVSKLISDINPAYSHDLKKYYPELFERHLESKKRISYGLIRDNIMHGIDQKLTELRLKLTWLHIFISAILRLLCLLRISFVLNILRKICLKSWLKTISEASLLKKG